MTLFARDFGQKTKPVAPSSSGLHTRSTIQASSADRFLTNASGRECDPTAPRDL